METEQDAGLSKALCAMLQQNMIIELTVTTQPGGWGERDPRVLVATISMGDQVISRGSVRVSELMGL